MFNNQPNLQESLEQEPILKTDSQIKKTAPKNQYVLKHSEQCVKVDQKVTGGDPVDNFMRLR